MTRFPRLKGKEVVRILQRIGFQIFLGHEDGRVTTVPVHSGETIGPGLLRSILRDVELSVEDLIRNS